MINSKKFYQEAVGILQAERYCVLSTATLDGEPWCSPVFFAHDKAVNLFWISEEASQHSQLLAENARASCVIFDSSATAGAGNGLYLSGAVQIRTIDQLEPLELLKARGPMTGDFSRYELSDVNDDSPWRLYQFSPEKAWVLGDNYDVRGWAVVRRQELDLSLLREAV